ncbi:MAG: peptidyl-prolyl cis-trans isomerase [Halioglobus sp.]
MSSSLNATHLSCIALGVVVGGLAAYGWLQAREASPDLAADTAALVNGDAIQAEHYQKKLTQLKTEQNTDPASQDIRSEALAELIHLRLLVSLGVERGVFFTDATLERALRQSLMSAAAVAVAEPSQSDLKAHYAANGSQFRKPAKVLIQRMVFTGAQALDVAERAHALLVEGAEFESIKAQYGSPDLLALPPVLVDANSLAGFLGEKLTRIVVHLPRGAFTEPLSEAGGYVILRVRDNEPAKKPPLETIRPQVLEHYYQYQQAQTLELQLAALRKAATVISNDALLQNESGD